jgi:16S rRNA (guanine527-N7)-methyltransferase
MSRDPSRDFSEAFAGDRAAALGLVPVSRETAERLDVYVELLGRWRRATNLIAEASYAAVWTRHIADSAQILRLAPGARRWLDMGSGAGFPGLVIAIALADCPGALVHCIESDRRKCAFLREIVRATGAKAEIHPERVEAVDPARLGSVEAITARAFAPLPKTVALARAWLDEGAVGVFPRGRSAFGQLVDFSRDDLAPAQAFAVEVVPSVVDKEAGILVIRRR